MFGGIRMYLVLKRDWEAIDGSTGKRVTIPQGRHEVERVSNPLGYDSVWIVLKGTAIGATEGSWRQWEPGQVLDNPDHSNHGKVIDWAEFEVIIEK